MEKAQSHHFEIGLLILELIALLMLCDFNFFKQK